jgi:hypothetical protein
MGRKAIMLFVAERTRFIHWRAVLRRLAGVEGQLAGSSLLTCFVILPGPVGAPGFFVLLCFHVVLHCLVRFLSVVGKICCSAPPPARPGICVSGRWHVGSAAAA